MGRKEVSGANFSHAGGRAGAFFTGDWTAERMKTPFILPILFSWQALLKLGEFVVLRVNTFIVFKIFI